MKKALLCTGAIVLVAALSACGNREEPANNMTVENDMNAMTNVETTGAAEPVTNTSAEAPAPEAVEPEPTAAKSTAPKPATSPPNKPKPAEPAPDAHAGHDMNNM